MLANLLIKLPQIAHKTISPNLKKTKQKKKKKKKKKNQQTLQYHNPFTVSGIRTKPSGIIKGLLRNESLEQLLVV